MNNYQYYSNLQLILGALQTDPHNGPAKRMIKDWCPELHDLLTWNTDDPEGFRFEATREIIRLLIDAPAFFRPLGITECLKDGTSVFKVIDGYPVLEDFYKYSTVRCFRLWNDADVQYDLVRYLYLD